jgi:chemotaxis protein CheZ
MAEQRKVFRIEQTMGRACARSVNPQDRDSAGNQSARVKSELAAIVTGTAQATDQVLKSAEGIDEIARTLSTLAGNQFEKDMIQDLQERVTQIFEACNFQDLIGQRVGKVTAALAMLDEHLARMAEIRTIIERCNDESLHSTPHGFEASLNGPKLDGDCGHVSQDDIDKMFH